MRAFDLDKILEILNVLIKRGPSTPYEVYKESRLTLATAYRYIKKALDLGYVRENYGLIELTLKGLLLLALHDNKDAIYLLSKYLGFNEDVVIKMIEEFRKRINIFDLNSLKIENIRDLLYHLMDNEDISSFAKRFKDTPLEPLIAYLIIHAFPTVTLNDGTKAVISDSGALAVACAEKSRNCPLNNGYYTRYLNRNDGLIYRLQCTFDCMRTEGILVMILRNDSFQECENSPYKSVITLKRNGTSQDRAKNHKA
jgi:hypothetical protein